MITANGKLQIKRYLARQVGEIASFLALGTGSQAANVNDSRLSFEVARVPVQSISVDPNSDKVVFRSTFAPGAINMVHEIGLWAPSPIDTSRFLNVLSATSPVLWTNGTLTSTNARANTDALKIDYVANGTTNSELTGIMDDLSAFQDTDSLVVAYHATTNLSSVRVRMGTDSTNYYEFVLPAPVANSYNVARVVRSAATRTGNPDWSAIRYIAVRPSATAAGAGSIFLDGIKMEANSLGSTNLLVARTVLVTPTALSADISSDVEYSIGVTIT